MDAVTLWAGVQFQAQNGDTDGLLTEAARQGLHLSEVLPCPGGFTARCAAWHYQRLAALARRKHVLLRIQAKTGLFFRLRPLLRRTGLWAGILLFVPLLLWLQGFVWTVQFQDHRHAAGDGWADARVPRHGTASRCRRICPPAERRVFMGESEFSGWASHRGGRRCKTRAGDRIRNAPRHPGKGSRHGRPHQPRQRHDAGHTRAAG